MKAERVPVPREAQQPDAGYASAFALPTANAPGRSPEEWARATFEQAPALIRPVLLGVWRFILRLRLGPRPSPEHVLGWRIEDSDDSSITLQAGSPLMDARAIVTVDARRVSWITAIRFENRTGRVVWAAIAPIHHVVIPNLLRYAGRTR